MQRRAETDSEIWCGHCREMHIKSAFGRYRKSASGYAYVCKDAVSDLNRRAHAKARDANSRRHAKNRRAQKDGPDKRVWAIKKLLSDAKRRADGKGLEFSVALCDLILPDTCPVFGWPLIYQADGHRENNSASIDRVDNNLGYVPGNVWIISWRANHIKSDSTSDELRTVADAIDLRHGPQTCKSANSRR